MPNLRPDCFKVSWEVHNLSYALNNPLFTENPRTGPGWRRSRSSSRPTASLSPTLCCLQDLCEAPSPLELPGTSTMLLVFTQPPSPCQSPTLLEGCCSSPVDKASPRSWPRALGASFKVLRLRRQDRGPVFVSNLFNKGVHRGTFWLFLFFRIANSSSHNSKIFG